MQVVTKFAARVISERPLYGPKAGGTPVTIRGQYLNTLRDVYFGRKPGGIDRRRSAVDLFLSCMSVLLQTAYFAYMYVKFQRQMGYSGAAESTGNSGATV